MGRIGCPETSVRNYQHSLRNSPEERNTLRHICLFVGMDNSVPTGRISWNLMEYFSKICPKNSSFINVGTNNGCFTWWPIYIFDHISLSSPWNKKSLRQSCIENQNTFNFQYLFFRKSYVYYIIWKNAVEPYRPQMTIWRMRMACWIPKATKTHS